MAVRIVRLFEAVTEDPIEHIGKPEPPKHDQPNTWSNCINQEHRKIYVVYDDKIHCIATHHHYQKS
jgi:toxin YoeB